MEHVRKTNVLTNKTTLETLFSFENFPTYVGCVNTPKSDDTLLDLTIDICKETGILQIKKLASLDQVYLLPHNDAIGTVWQEHNENFIKFIELVSPKKILEIGGGSGQLATNFITKHENVDWTILDPNPLFDGNLNIHSIKQYFSPELSLDKQYDVIIHSHVLEHQPLPEEFFKNISKFLIPNGFLIFSFPNLNLWLSKKYLNCMNFEHTIFLTETYVDCILKRTGFELLNKMKYADHSIFYLTKYTGNVTPTVFPNLYLQNKQLYMNYVKYYKDFVSEVNLKLEDFHDKVFLFGAHIFSQYLLAFGINRKKIYGILDNSLLKINKRLYGTDLSVYSPESIKNEENVGVILKVGSYRNEIIEQLKTINPNVTIFE